MGSNLKTPLAMRLPNILLQACTFIALVCMMPAANGQDYIEPDFGRPLFIHKEVALTPADLSALVAVLVELAKQEDVDSGVKSDALALAYTFSPGNREVLEVNFSLRNGIKFSSFLQPRDKAEVIAALTQLVSVVEGADKTLGAKAADLTRRLAEAAGMVRLNRTQDPATGVEQTAVLVERGIFPRENANIGGVFLTDVEVSRSTSKIETRWKWIAESMKPTMVRANVLETGRRGTFITVVQGEMPPELGSAMREMVKMFSLKSVEIPNSNSIEISFEEGYSGGDGPSGVLSCALLVDALVNDTALDPECAIIGDLNADGSIQPIFYIRERLEAIQNADEGGTIKLMGIPAKNASSLGDILLLDGIDPIFETQIFTLDSFDEAKRVAVASDFRSAEIQEAIELFAEVQSVLRRSSSLALLRNQQVKDRLSRVLELAPNHASAKLLLLRGMDRHPRRLTLSGSLDEMLHAYVYLDRGKSPKYDSLQTAVTSLGKARSAFDPRSLEWLDSIIQYHSTKRRQSLNLSSSQQAELRKQITLTLNRVELEYQKLMSDPEAREALMR